MFRHMAGLVGSAIAGVGTYLPARRLGNDHISRHVAVTPEWIEQRTGVATRHRAGDAEDVVTMAVEAGSKAIAAANVDPAEVDLVVLATATRRMRIPGAAAQVASRVGLVDVGAFDINAVCAGFTYALAQASNAVRVGDARSALVIGVERTRDFVHPDQPDVFAIFGDGAGAVVVTRSEEPGIGPVVWGSDGERAGALEIRVRDGDEFIFMKGPIVYKWSTGVVPAAMRRACALAGVDLADIDWFIPHQANLRIIDTVVRATSFPLDRVSRDVVEMGNTSAASIPLALGRLLESGRTRPGDRALMMGFGAGLTYAGQVVRLP
jgi:3-oxoacyl-[acyl-carrier-protein] synthase-3